MNLLRDKFAELVEFIPSRIQKLLVLFTLVVLISVTMTSLFRDLQQPVNYTQGQISRQTIRAPHDFLVEDPLTTEKRRATAVAGVKPVFSVNRGVELDPALHLKHLLAATRELATPSGQKAGPLELSATERSTIERRFHLNLVGEEWPVLLDPSLWPELETAVVSLVQPVVEKGIIQSKTPLRNALEKGSAILLDKSTNTEVQITNESALLDVDEALAEVRSLYPSDGFRHGKPFDDLVLKLAALTVQPNVKFDPEETERRIILAKDQVDASVMKIQRGQVLVRAGDLVSPSQEIVLQYFRKSQSPNVGLRFTLGYMLLSTVIILSVYYFGTTFWSNFTPGAKDLTLGALTLWGSLLLLKLFSILAESLSYSFSALDSTTMLLATPLAAGGILLQVTLGSTSVFMYVMTFALLTGAYLSDSWLPTLMIVAGNFVGATAVRRCSRRSTFLVAGIRVAGVNMLLTGTFLMFFPELSLVENASKVLWAAVGGLLSGILAGSLVPIAEFIGGYATDFKLLELASLDRPLLRELSLQAPGTWNHSMVVAQIAEVAAESVGANPLLARVGAFYHDIGKSKKPAYFVENQTGENRHDKLSPPMSALIIKTHVKDGIEMAEAEHLPQAIVDFIPQHHGTSLIEYFYEKAVKEAEQDEIVDESLYRYPGPKPQTKEAGIIMLADSVEAAARTLNDPSPAKIRGLVQKMINKIFAGGELGECNLTLKDLHLIAKSFTRVLTGIYHRRVEYSEPADKIKEKDAKSKTKNGTEGGEIQAVGSDTITLPKEGENRSIIETEDSRRTSESAARRTAVPDNKEALKRLGM